MEAIIAVNDGGLGIEYKVGGNLTEWQPHRHKRPVLSVEVSSPSPPRGVDLD
jgi:hypothetical protein